MKWLAKISFVAAIGFSLFFYLKFGQTKSTFHADSLGYYSYLPAFFTLDNFDEINRLPRYGSVPERVLGQLDNYAQLKDKKANGHVIFAYTYGVSLFESPFYLAAEFYCKLTKKKSSGYTEIHNKFMQFSNAFYVLLGLLFTFIVLAKLFDKNVALLTVSLILLGTNLFWFTTLHFGMAHPIIFFLVAALIYQTIHFYENPTQLRTILIFLTLGFLTLLRPTDILFGLVPLLYNIDSWISFKKRLLFLKERWLQLALALPFFLLPFIPQFIYWQIFAGTWFYYTHGNESFNFLRPQIIKGLFGPDNGWLLYSPFCILAVIPLFTRHKLKGFKLVLLTLLPIYIYVIYSWQCYQYINGFGSRPMLHMYALLAIPLAITIRYLVNKKGLALLVSGIVGFFIYINLHFSYLNNETKYWSEFSNYEFYWNMMFKNQLSYNDLVVRDSKLFQPNEKNLEKVRNLITYSTVHDTLMQHRYDTIIKDSVLVFSSGEETPAFWVEHSIGKIDSKKKHYIKATCASYHTQFNHDPYQSLLMIHKFSIPGETLSWNALNLYTKSGLPNDRNLAMDSIWLHRGTINIWDTLSFFIPIETENEQLVSRVDFWNMIKMEFYLRFVQLELYKEKE